MLTRTEIEKGRVLKLTLNKAPFDVMLSGEKQCEYRRPSDYILSRLRREYDYVMFFNGGYTGGVLPWFACPFNGFDVAREPANLEFSNGLQVIVSLNDFIINLGPVVAFGNLKASHSPSAPTTREKEEGRG
jgi:hypothetical protein